MRFGRTTVTRWRALPVLVLIGLPSGLSQCLSVPSFSSYAPAAEDLHDHPPAPRPQIEREPPAPPPIVKRVLLAEEVIVRAMTAVQPSFLRCFARAQDEDPSLGSVKVRLHMEVDAAGLVTSMTTDLDQDPEKAKFVSCLTIVTRQVRFPAPGVPAVVDMPLFFGSGS